VKIKPETIFKLIVVAMLALTLGAAFNLVIGAINGFLPEGLKVGLDLILSGLILGYALKMHRGVERFLQDLPLVLVVFGIASMFSILIPAVPFVLEFSLTGIALALAEFYLASALVSKYVKL